MLSVPPHAGPWPLSHTCFTMLSAPTSLMWLLIYNKQERSRSTTVLISLSGNYYPELGLCSSLSLFILFHFNKQCQHQGQITLCSDPIPAPEDAFVALSSVYWEFTESSEVDLVLSWPIWSTPDWKLPRKHILWSIPWILCWACTYPNLQCVGKRQQLQKFLTQVQKTDWIDSRNAEWFEHMGSITRRKISDGNFNGIS